MGLKKQVRDLETNLEEKAGSAPEEVSSTRLDDLQREVRLKDQQITKLTKQREQQLHEKRTLSDQLVNARQQLLHFNQPIKENSDTPDSKESSALTKRSESSQE